MRVCVLVGDDRAASACERALDGENDGVNLAVLRKRRREKEREREERKERERDARRVRIRLWRPSRRAQRPIVRVLTAVVRVDYIHRHWPRASGAGRVIVPPVAIETLCAVVCAVLAERQGEKQVKGED